MKRLLKRYNEFLTIPLGLILWVLSVPLIRLIDPTAAVFDAGIFQKIVFAIVAFSILKGAAWGFFRLAFPDLKKYLDEQFEETILSQLKAHQLCSLLAFYFLFYLFSLVLLTLAI